MFCCQFGTHLKIKFCFWFTLWLRWFKRPLNCLHVFFFFLKVSLTLNKTKLKIFKCDHITLLYNYFIFFMALNKYLDFTTFWCITVCHDHQQEKNPLRFIQKPFNQSSTRHMERDKQITLNDFEDEFVKKKYVDIDIFWNEV